ncbi:putative endo-1,3(4)-beta-glucanase [Botrytis cinerea]
MSPRSVFLYTNLLLSLPLSITALVPYIQGTYQQYATATYSLKDTYNSANFFSAFSFFTDADPTHGYVSYQSQSAASAQGLINTNNGQVYLGVDYKTVNPSAGRASVRLTSNKAYNHGLFIADIAHMPGSICGVWPAFWLVGPNWPYAGEIDVIEGVNLAGTNSMTLHTGPGCVINTAGSQPGITLSDPNCNSNSGYNGCGVLTNKANSYGDGFNSVGGGVYAMQWESSGIYVWFWPRGSVPADVTAGKPVTVFFANQQIVFDTTFCGDWAGSVWSSGNCASVANTCNAYVGANPGAFAPAYWLINSVKVYQQ